MRREPSFRAQDTIIWATTLLLAAVLGGVAAYFIAGVFGSANAPGAIMRDMLALTGAGFILIIMALQGRLVRAVFLSFTLVFFVGLVFATHALTRF